MPQASPVTSVRQLIVAKSDGVLPASIALQSMILVSLGASPFLTALLPFQISAALGLMLSIIMVLVSFAAALVVTARTWAAMDQLAFAVLAKRVGQPFDRDAPRLRALETAPLGALIMTLLEVAMVACVLISSAAGITFAMIGPIGLPSPFTARPGPVEIVVYFSDQALKGGLLDLCEVFRISISDVSIHSPGFGNLFCYGLFGFRALMSLLTLQLLLLVASYRFFASRDGRFTLPEQLDNARRDADAARKNELSSEAARSLLEQERQEARESTAANNVLESSKAKRYLEINRAMKKGDHVDQASLRWWERIRVQLKLDQIK